MFRKIMNPLLNNESNINKYLFIHTHFPFYSFVSIFDYCYLTFSTLRALSD